MRGSPSPRRGAELNQLSIIPDGSLLVRDGILEEVGPTRRVENLALARHATEISAAGRVVMPGFIDSHTHMLFPAPSRQNGNETGGQDLHTTTTLRLKARALAFVESMARHGTTTAEVKTGSGPDAASELKILRVATSLKNEPLSLTATFLFQVDPSGETTESWVCQEFLPRIRRRSLASFVDISWEPDMERSGLAARYLSIARRLGLARKVHAGHTAPGGAVRLGVAYGALSIDHLEHASPADVAQLGRRAGVCTLLPGASLHGDGTFAPARALVDNGAPIALASNFNPLQTPTVSMQAVVALACQHLGLTPAEAISAATINGAHALDCSGVAGSLEPGKAADLTILNISDYRELGHNLGANLVHLTMKRGAFIYEEGVVAPRPAEDLRSCW